jgi:hypothetical protein
MPVNLEVCGLEEVETTPEVDNILIQMWDEYDPEMPADERYIMYNLAHPEIDYFIVSSDICRVKSYELFNDDMEPYDDVFLFIDGHNIKVDRSLR